MSCSSTAVLAGAGEGHVAGRPEDGAHGGLEGFQRKRVVLRVEAVLIVLLAELRAVPPPLVVTKSISHVPVEAHVVKEVVALKDRVLLDDPVVLGGDEGLQDRRGELGAVTDISSSRLDKLSIN